jgi:hypothetical protein
MSLLRATNVTICYVVTLPPFLPAPTMVQLKKHRPRFLHVHSVPDTVPFCLRLTHTLTEGSVQTLNGNGVGVKWFVIVSMRDFNDTHILSSVYFRTLSYSF